ncbi:hypothetical protein GMJAKD_07020 [Candidatus Electrothrix aarhusensis]
MLPCDQYEIQFNPSSQDKKQVEELTNKGLLEYDDDSEYYGFYHSDFAKLLLRSYQARKSFSRGYSNLDDFTVQQLTNYFLDFHGVILRMLMKLFSTLSSTKGYRSLKLCSEILPYENSLSDFIATRILIPVIISLNYYGLLIVTPLSI